MRTPPALLRFIARAALNIVGGGVLGDFAVEVLPHMGKDVWKWWNKGQPEDELIAEFQAVGQLSNAETKDLAELLAQEEAAGQPETVRLAVANYVALVPNAIRQSQRRPADPSGLSLSSSFSLRRPEDLLLFLPNRMPRFRPGDRPSGIGDWELEELLGIGGFGEVWKAHNPHLPRSVAALKFCTDLTAAKVLRNETSLLGRVMSEGKHRGIVRLLHTYLNADTPCLEYEYVAGGDLSKVIAQWHRSPSASTVDKATKLITNLAEIVGYAHKLNPPIVHRDLKPSNILLHLIDKGAYALRVADFGIGGVVADQALAVFQRDRSSRGSLGIALRGAHTPLYASPQQVRGEPPDPRDDVHALGVIWYQLLTGDMSILAVPADWQDEVRGRGLSDEWVALLSSCLASRVEKRPTDAAELAQQIKKLQTKAIPQQSDATTNTTSPKDRTVPSVLDVPSSSTTNPTNSRKLDTPAQQTVMPGEPALPEVLTVEPADAPARDLLSRGKTEYPLREQSSSKGSGRFWLVVIGTILGVAVVYFLFIGHAIRLGERAEKEAQQEEPALEQREKVESERRLREVREAGEDHQQRQKEQDDLRVSPEKRTAEDRKKGDLGAKENVFDRPFSKSPTQITYQPPPIGAAPGNARLHSTPNPKNAVASEQKSEIKPDEDTSKGKPGVSQHKDVRNELAKRSEVPQKDNKMAALKMPSPTYTHKDHETDKDAAKLPPLKDKLKGLETDKAAAEKKMLRQAKLTAEVIAVVEEKKSLRLRLTIPYVRINQSQLLKYNIAQANLLRVTNAQVRNDALNQMAQAASVNNARNQMAQAAANVYELATVQKEVEWRTGEEFKVRMISPPPQFDDNGRPKRYTSKELRELKGNDKLPGYQAEFSDIKAGQFVQVTLQLKKTALPPVKRGEELSDDDPPHVSLIVILVDPKN